MHIVEDLELKKHTKDTINARSMSGNIIKETKN
jgi:hypothetical protein